MAFWNRTIDSKDLPEALKDKRPEEIVAMLAKYDEMERAAVDERKKREELEQQASAQRSEFDQMKGKLAELESRQTPPPQETPVQPEEPVSPWVDPQGFVRNEMKPLANVALTSGMITAKMYFEQGLRDRDRRIFKKYEDEVMKGVNTFAPEARVMPQSWFNMFMFVKGSHEDDIRKAETENPDSFFSEMPSRGESPEPVPEDKLTAEEQEVCEKFHYDPKRYLAARKLGETKGGARGMFATYTVPMKGGDNAGRG